MFILTWVRKRAHKLFLSVNQPVVPGSTGHSPEQKVYVHVPFSLMKLWMLFRPAFLPVRNLCVFVLYDLLNVREEKGTPNPNILVRISSGGVGVFHVKGRGPKSSVSFEAQGNATFWRHIPGFCRDIPGTPEKFEKKFVFNSRPL